MFSFENTRYNRQINVPLLGVEGQSKLASSTVVVVGAGGVKSPVLYYLAAAGIGAIKIIDFDKVELSNLNRQILYTEHDIGRYKAEAAKDRLIALNSDISITSIVDKIDHSNMSEHLENCDLAFEGGDSEKSRGDFNRAALKMSVPYIHASAKYNYGYVLTVMPDSACFECFNPDPIRERTGPVPVVGTATGVAGSVAASEAVAYLVTGKPNFVNKVWFHDCWIGKSLELPIDKRKTCAACGQTTVD